MNVYVVLFLFQYCTALLTVCNGYKLSNGANNVGQYKVYRVRSTSGDQLEFLKSLRKRDSNMKVDFWKESVLINGTSDIMVPQNLQEKFEKLLVDHDIQFTVTIEDVQKLINEQDSNANWTDNVLMDDSRRSYKAFGKFNFRRYQDYSDMKSFMHSLEKYYPSIAKVITLGYTGEKRPIEMLKISYPINSDSKKAIWIDAGIHAREWIAPSTAMYFINELVTKYDKDPLITQYVNNLTWYITPVVNPDGYDYTRSSKDLDMRLWRKNRSPNNGNSCKGIDLNRNFDSHWGEFGAGEDPCDDDYRGSSAFSEPESRAVRDFVMSHNKEIQAFITLHSYGQIWMHPFGFHTKVYPPDVAELKDLAIKATNALKNVYGTSYIVGSGADTMYETSGASDDWSKLKAGIKYVYLIELRPKEDVLTGFMLPPNQIIPTGRETWEGMKVVASTILQKNGITVTKEETTGRRRGRNRNK